MNKKGFVTSALLYGILSLFLVLMLGTLSVISSRKLANDRLKESAINDVQDLDTKKDCFTMNGCNIIGYNKDTCGNTIAIDINNFKNCYNITIEDNSITGISRGNVYIKSKIKEEANDGVIVIKDDAFKGNVNITFIVNQQDIEEKTGEIWGATNSVIKRE